MTVADFITQHGLALMEGSGTTVLVFVVIKHIPTWPLSWQKLYDWVRDSLQDFASQRGAPTNPTQAAPPQK